MKNLILSSNLTINENFKNSSSIEYYFNNFIKNNTNVVVVIDKIPNQGFLTTLLNLVKDINNNTFQLTKTIKIDNTNQLLPLHTIKALKSFNKKYINSPIVKIIN